MWNKRNDEGEAPRPQSQPEPPRFAQNTAPAPVRPASPPPTRMAATIGASMIVKGDITSREELLIEGEVEGSVESHSVLTVGASGKVKANVKAREVIIYGSVRGNVEVTEKILIREQGSLVGDIKAAGIGIDDGAYFKGSIDIVRPEPKAVPKKERVEERVETMAAR